MKPIFLILALLGAVALSAKEASPSKVPSLPAIVPPLPVVVAYAASHQIAIDGIDVPEPSATGRVGDSITALVVFREGSRSKQWLIQFRIATPTVKEVSDNPPTWVTMTATTSGRKYQFGSGAVLALDIRTVGPFIEGQNAPANEKQSRAFIGPDLLGMGLDGSCRAMLKLNAAVALAKTATPASAGSPAPIILSEEDEREYLGCFPALLAFFQSVQATPGLREILWEITDKPSVWSIIKHGGKINATLNGGGDVTVAGPEGWTVAGSALYRFPLLIELNETPALQCTLLVTSPQPPLLTCAGIVGIAAEPPGNKDKRLDVRIIAAHRAAQ